MDFLNNISINLHATGPAAVLIAWIICFTALALFGTGALAAYGEGALGSFGILLLFALARKVE